MPVPFKRTVFSEDEMDKKKKKKPKNLGCLSFSFSFCRSKKKEKKNKPPERFGCKKRCGAFHSLQYAGEKG